MPVNRRRLLELAAERLEAERLRIDEELVEVQAELESEKSTPRTKTKTKTPTRKRRSRKLSATERKVISDRMKKYWAERKKKEKEKQKGKAKAKGK